MINYILRRLVTSVVLLFLVSIVTFGIFFLIPKVTGANPAQYYAGRVTTPAAVQGISIKLGLDKPIYEQYGLFVKGIFVGRDYNSGPDVTHCSAPCLGYSFVTDQEVWPLLLNRLPVTISLAIGAAVLWLVGGVAAGVISALRRGTWIDRAVMIGALAGVSMPIFFTGQIAQLLFVFQLHWFQPAHYTPFASNPWSWATGLFLAWVTLAWLYAATYARLTRATMLETLGEDYVRTARAKGLRERVVLRRHVMRSVMTPIVTVFGLDLGGLIGGAILTEQVFSLPGLGKLAVEAIGRLDLPIILGVTMLAGFFIIAANFLVDLLYAVIDPRVRLS